MKKKPAFPSWTGILLPLLPLFPFLVSWKAGLNIACSGAVIFLALAIAAKLVEKIFDKERLSLLFILASAAAVYCLNALWDLPAALVLSLFLLSPAGLEEKKRSQRTVSIFFKTFFYFTLILFLTAAQEYLGGVLHQSFFQRISGSFLLLALPALFWPASRKVKGKISKRPGFAGEFSPS